MPAVFVLPQRPRRTQRALSGITALLAALLTSVTLAQTPRTADQWYAQGQTQLKARQYALAAQSFEQAAKLNPTAANWRWLGEARVQAGDLSGASSAFDQAIAGYRARHDLLTAQALENRVAPYRQEGEFYLLPDQTNQTGAVTRDATGAVGAEAGLAGPNCGPNPPKRAKFEPLSGLLLGTYVNERGLTPGGQLSEALTRNANFAVYFRYFKLKPTSQLRQPEDSFPRRFVNAVKEAGGAVHIALEPGLPLKQITAATVTPFAKAAGAAGVPIFLRFAGEFNDPQNEWSRDPVLYRAKFRLVHDVMARYAPNVAMVWMPMASRLEVLDRYYPGADAVDWVGVSLFAVPYRNGNLRDSTVNMNPIDVLAPLYAKYACTHPIQVSEFASAHRSSANPNADYTAFATAKLRNLYWGALLKYPRLKNINWLDTNMIGNRYVQLRAGTRQNDYRLLDIPAKWQAFQELTEQPYFARKYRPDLNLPRPQSFPSVLNADRLGQNGKVQVALWLKTFDADATLNNVNTRSAPQVQVTLNGQPLPTTGALPYRFEFSSMNLQDGPNTLEARVMGADGRVVLTKKQVFSATSTLASAPQIP